MAQQREVETRYVGRINRAPEMKHICCFCRSEPHPDNRSIIVKSCCRCGRSWRSYAPSTV